MKKTLNPVNVYVVIDTEDVSSESAYLCLVKSPLQFIQMYFYNLYPLTIPTVILLCIIDSSKRLIQASQALRNEQTQFS